MFFLFKLLANNDACSEKRCWWGDCDLTDLWVLGDHSWGQPLASFQPYTMYEENNDCFPLVSALPQQTPSMCGLCELCPNEDVPQEPPGTYVWNLLLVSKFICLTLECRLILLALAYGIRLPYLNLDKFFIRKYLFLATGITNIRK